MSKSRAFLAKHPVLTILIVAAASAIAIFVLGLSKSNLEAWDYIGGGFTLGGALLAVFIYLITAHDTDRLRAAFESGQNAIINRIDEHEKDRARSQAQNDQEPTDDVEPVVPNTDKPRDHEVIEGVSFYPPGAIPLRVIADLVVGWASLDTHDRRGWTIGDVRWAQHKETGKGNHPWYVLTQDTEDPENRVLWRITRGGREKTGPTVREA
jgi:hypothetical protein